jgi:hypothetical protein
MIKLDYSQSMNKGWANTWVQCVRSGVSTSEEPALCPFSEQCWHAKPHKVKRCKESHKECLWLNIKKHGFCSILNEEKQAYVQ